jgi:hypothetical protein
MDGQQRRVSWMAGDKPHSSFPLLPVRIRDSLPPANSRSDEPDKEGIAAPPFVCRIPVAEGAAGNREMVVQFTERLEQRYGL